MVNFPIRIPDCDSPALLDLFISSDPSICSTVLSINWITLIILLPQFPLTVLQTQKGCPFHCTACEYFCIDCVGLQDHTRDAPGEDLFKLSASAAN